MRAAAIPLLLALTATAASLSACSRNECVERGSSTSYDGSASYDGQLVTSTGAVSRELAGASTGTLVMDDFSPFSSGQCTEDNIEFTVRIGSCVVVADETSENHDTGKHASGDFLGATAAIVSSLGCTLDLAEGAAVVSVQSGTFQVGPSSAQLTLSGTLVSLKGVSAAGQIQWTFTGQ